MRKCGHENEIAPLHKSKSAFPAQGEKFAQKIPFEEIEKILDTNAVFFEKVD